MSWDTVKPVLSDHGNHYRQVVAYCWMKEVQKSGAERRSLLHYFHAAIRKAKTMSCCIWSLNTGILSFSSSMNDRRGPSREINQYLEWNIAHVRHIDAASLEIICECFTPVKIMIKEIWLKFSFVWGNAAGAYLFGLAGFSDLCMNSLITFYGQVHWMARQWTWMKLGAAQCSICT